MADIINAIKVEEEYIQYRLNNEEPFILIDEIKKCGFDNLNDYFKAKELYLFSTLNFNVIEKPMPYGLDEVFKVLESKSLSAIVVDWEDTLVLCGEDGVKTFNEDYCKENDILVRLIHTGGGTIFGTKGDFSLGISIPSNMFTDTNFILNKMADIIQKYTSETVVVDRNDILINGYKVCGSANYRLNDIIMIVFYFSFSDKLDLISKICTTDKVSKPIGHINSMTREEFKKEVREWLRLY